MSVAMKDVVLVNLGLVVIGVTVMSAIASRESGQKDVFLFSLLPLLGYLVAANLALLMVSLLIPSQRKRAGGYAVSALMLVIGGVLALVFGVLTLGKIGG
ncbi:hypothetical protein LGH70_04485 [Hymenobacter sp. BT635]|uniref:Uncharacterized protein n=1 Tax=Hymenobacter nitidus TaxID=2880929 RepID=A0ABS8ACR9_9BACT|nr:hypothetical protein [Hymenobacter nitidus]MCB2376824.1 hypothetical protein [Hymenobacter nitidus]